MSVVDLDAVALEHGLELGDDGCARGLDAVESQHGVDVVGEEFGGVDDVLVVAHGEEIDAFCHDVGRSVLLGDIRASSEARDELDDGFAAGEFNMVEHEDFGRRNVVLNLQSAKVNINGDETTYLEHKLAPRPIFIVKGEAGKIAMI